MYVFRLRSLPALPRVNLLLLIFGQARHCHGEQVEHLLPFGITWHVIVKANEGGRLAPHDGAEYQIRDRPRVIRRINGVTSVRNFQLIEQCRVIEYACIPE